MSPSFLTSIPMSPLPSLAAEMKGRGPHFNCRHKACFPLCLKLCLPLLTSQQVQHISLPALCNRIFLQLSARTCIKRMDVWDERENMYMLVYCGSLGRCNILQSFLLSQILLVQSLDQLNPFGVKTYMLKVFKTTVCFTHHIKYLVQKMAMKPLDLELKMLVSRHVGAGSQTQVFWKNCQYSGLLNQLSVLVC